MTAWIWLLLVTAGAAAVGVFIYFGQERTKHRLPVQAEARRDAATRDLYRDEDGGRS
jgi:DhnA family fructose-bisphosphate aldolase class Ia